MKALNLILLLLLFLLSCTDRPGVDKFYTDQGEFDMSRFPMIKPYEAITSIPHDKYGWFIQMYQWDTTFSAYAGNIVGVQRLNLIDTVIFAYAQNTLILGQEEKEGWFVLIPKKPLLKEFKTQQEYLKYLDTLGVKPPKLFNPDDVLQYYFAKDTLDWEAYNRSH